MIIVLKPEATPETAHEILARIEEKGLKPLYMPGTERVVLGALGDERVLAELSLDGHPMVESLKPILAPYKLVSREMHPHDTVVRFGKATIGGTRLCRHRRAMCGRDRRAAARQRFRRAQPPAQSAFAPARTSRAPALIPSRAMARKGSDAAQGRRRARPAGRHRGDGHGRRRHRRRACRHAADRRAQHAEFLAAARRSGSSASRCCSSAASRPRSRICCSPPNISSPRATTR